MNCHTQSSHQQTDPCGCDTHSCLWHYSLFSESRSLLLCRPLKCACGSLLSVQLLCVCVEQRGPFFCLTDEAGEEVETRAEHGSVGASLRGQRQAGNWVLTEQLPHGPMPIGHVLHRHDVAATTAASHPWPLPLWRDGGNISGSVQLSRYVSYYISIFTGSFSVSANSQVILLVNKYKKYLDLWI